MRNSMFVALGILMLSSGIAFASEEAPAWWGQVQNTAERDCNNVADHRNDNVPDHRNQAECAPDPIVRDHRDPSATTQGDSIRDHRGESHQVERDPNEEVENHVVPARRGTPPGGRRPDRATEPTENAPEPRGLLAPSDLDTSDVGSTTAVLHWMDNSTREWGVEMYRMDPVAARRDGVITWHLISDIDERRDVNVGGTGMREDEDFDLTPGTNYCYRLRAYVGFDKSEVSNFSGITCMFTSS